jgi:hypothetical protein
MLSFYLFLDIQSGRLASGFLTNTCIPGRSVGGKGFGRKLLLAVLRKERIGASARQVLQDSSQVTSEYMTRVLPLHVRYISHYYSYLRALK